ncbi:MAG TPA: patatin-like phospholipase family protein [Solirubrobacteraceae bacterium]|jgi:NTE family protein
MADKISRQPDVLVLGGGGILGEAWMSAVLTGLEESGRVDSRACRIYLGTSAGSIVAAALAAGLAPGARLGRLPEQPPYEAPGHDDGSPLRQTLGTAFGIGGAAVAPLASLALSSSATGGALLRRAALRRVPKGTRSLQELGAAVERSGVEWDGRLRVAAVELQSGRRVIFGAAGAPALSVAAAVQASCAIPGVFRPVELAGRSYVDGGAWSPTNMDGAEARRGELVLCLNPTGSFRPAIGSLAGAVGPVSRGVATTEALVLRHRGAEVSLVNPDDACTVALGNNLMDGGRREGVIAAGLAQGRRLGAASLPHAA